jgi:prophage regulatory protein
MAERVLSKAEVRQRTGFSDQTLRREEAAGRFPARRQLSPGKVGWLESEVDAFLRALPTGPLVARTAAANAARA